ncbi:hypothetical protein MalM14_07490 [Gimesia chilikensis]|nr:hypothetical protein MalM14_07490 [Gimesia chilikensis]
MVKIANTKGATMRAAETIIRSFINPSELDLLTNLRRIVNMPQHTIIKSMRWYCFFSIIRKMPQLLIFRKAT